MSEYILSSDRLVVVEGVLYRKWTNITTNEVAMQYILPNLYRNQVLELLHNDQLAVHLGFKRTLAHFLLYQYIWLQGSLLSVSHFPLSYHNEYSHHMVSWTNRLHCHVLVLPYVLC
jgi:hypothetical protein